MNELDIIKNALAVRDDGAEPQHDADAYDAALLFVAQREQRVSESVADALARVVATDDDADALFFAADRVRARNAALGKSSPVALDAERVAKSSAAPRFTRDQYHEEMMAVAKAAARSGEGVAGAFSRLCGDGAFDELYAAGEQAETAEVEAVLAKGVSRFDHILMDLAKMRRRSGETIEQCASRLLHEDPVVRDGYASTQGL